LQPTNAAVVVGVWEHNVWLRLVADLPLPQLPPALGPLRLRLADVQGDVLVNYLMAQIAAPTPRRA